MSAMARSPSPDAKSTERVKRKYHVRARPAVDEHDEGSVYVYMPLTQALVRLRSPQHFSAPPCALWRSGALNPGFEQ